MIIVNSKTQILEFYQNNKLVKKYTISTAKNGLGEEYNSFRTPRGKHKIYDKIGKNVAKNTIFIGRKPYYKLNINNNNDDLILSRILWLDGLEEFNKNSKNRYIYIHGTNDEKNIGKAVSNGCIRMKNDDIIELFNNVAIGEIVFIK